MPTADNVLYLIAEILDMLFGDTNRTVDKPTTRDNDMSKTLTSEPSDQRDVDD